MPTLIVSILSVLSLSACATLSTSPSNSAPAQPDAAQTPASQTSQQQASTTTATTVGPNGTPISLDASQKMEYPLKPEEKKPLLTSFRKTLSDQEKSLDREQKTSLKEFTTAQSQQLKEWRNQEKKAREAFFDQHLSGPDRRSYVQGYITRKKDFDQKQKEDLTAFKQAQKEKHETFKTNEKSRQTQFQSALDHNMRPSETLWTP